MGPCVWHGSCLGECKSKQSVTASIFMNIFIIIPSFCASCPSGIKKKPGVVKRRKKSAIRLQLTRPDISRFQKLIIINAFEQHKIN